jgi:hypothetical protein
VLLVDRFDQKGKKIGAQYVITDYGNTIIANTHEEALDLYAKKYKGIVLRNYVTDGKTGKIIGHIETPSSLRFSKDMLSPTDVTEYIRTGHGIESGVKIEMYDTNKRVEGTIRSRDGYYARGMV